MGQSIFPDIFALKKISFTTNAATIESHLANTVLDISGSGYLLCIKAATAFGASIQIDGGVIYVYNVSAGETATLFPLRFNTSLIIKSNAADSTAWAVLD